METTAAPSPGTRSTVIITYFLSELALIHDEAKALIDSPAQYLEARRTAGPPIGLEIYDRYVSLRQLIFMHFPGVSQGRWDRPIRAASLSRPDLRQLQGNTLLLRAGLLGLPSI